MTKSLENEQRTHSSVTERVNAVMSLEKVDHKNLAGKVKHYLADPSPTVRTASVEIIKKRRLQDLKSDVLALLSDKNAAVRYTAVECLGAFYENEGIAASWLYPLLKDPSELVRIETLESLGRIGDKEAIPLIVEKLEDNSPLIRNTLRC